MKPQFTNDLDHRFALLQWHFDVKATEPKKKSNLALIFIHIEGFLDVKMMAFESHHNYRKIYKQLHPPSNET